MPSLFEIPIENLKGIGDKTGKLFRKMEVNSVGDLLRFYPRQYEDWSSPLLIREAQIGDVCCVKAFVTTPGNERRIPGGRLITRFRIADESDSMTITFFNNKFVKNMLKEDSEYIFYGKITSNSGRKEMLSPEFLLPQKAQKIRPIYHCTAGITSRKIENAVMQSLQMLPKTIKEPLPKDILEKYDVCTLEFAINNIHFPKNNADLKTARKRLIFEELLILSLGLSMLKKGRKKETALKLTKDYSQEYFRMLPFIPTEGQINAVKDCIKDMTVGVSPMSRLIQGDVGCGKTAVAAAVCYTAVKNGWQAAFMAPTEILAEQHYKSLSNILKDTDINIALLTGSQTAKNKRLIREGLVNNEIHLVIGTHALISDNVKFSKLGLVVTDEQHRFGVSQRSKLVSKGDNPNLLIMSATPIPRTLALIIYGDLDISSIKELPPGRKTIDTFLVDSSKRIRMYNFLKKHMDNGQQCYIVCPAVEENDMLNIAAAEKYAENIKNSFFKDYRVGLLHGQMKSAQKDEIMRSFSNGEIDLLVSTTVIEVGIDVPNANVMVVENAERFGLSQLHQLRGRVGRGDVKSYCILMSDAKNEETLERLKTMCRTNNGFEIADADLKLRGPGDFFGSRQHGLPQMKIADLADMNYLSTAHQAAKEILAESPDLSENKFKGILAETIRLFNRAGENSLN